MWAGMPSWLLWQLSLTSVAGKLCTAIEWLCRCTTFNSVLTLPGCMRHARESIPLTVLPTLSHNGYNVYAVITVFKSSAATVCQLHPRVVELPGFHVELDHGLQVCKPEALAGHAMGMQQSHFQCAQLPQQQLAVFGNIVVLSPTRASSAQLMASQSGGNFQVEHVLQHQVEYERWPNLLIVTFPRRVLMKTDLVFLWFCL